MIGSHNSISYKKAIHWYQRFMKPWYQCQELSLNNQYSQGVRYFDIRVNWIDNQWHLVHNKIDFGILDTDTIEFFKKESWIRLGYDHRSTPKDTEECVTRFKTLIEYLTFLGWNIDSAITFWDWKEHLVPTINISEYHVSVSGKWYQYILGTKWFAKKFNQKYLKTHTEGTYLLDYINL